jgi:cytochrome oxidase Cu insertion factor (SCO1/SenC/PrrC family)
MPGMHTGLRTDNPVVLSAFKAAILHQFLVVLGILILLAVAWSVLRAAELRRAIAEKSSGPAASPWAHPEPLGRHVLRIGFGLLWVVDGILQAQSSIPLGMVPESIQPSAAASPAWIQHLVNVGTTIWSNHPIAASVSSIWIQVGIGIWLLVAPRGYWSRMGAMASLGWGLVVWVFGESFGGIFAPGLTWAFGAPGAVVLYCLAGLLIALPERYWTSPRLGRVVLCGIGSFFVGMALLQAWPGRGFWQGRTRASSAPGTLAGMVRQMALTPQPHVVSSWVTSFASFDAAHGWGVNLFLVISLAVIGTAFLSGRPKLVLPAVIFGIVLCLADWVLVEDLGFLGGTGTDPNSMIPIALVFVAGYLAMTRLPAANPTAVALAPDAAPPTWLERFRTQPLYALRSLAALGAFGVVLLGAAPMAVASTNPNADPILYQALDGTPNISNFPARPFSLVDQYGRTVSLASLRSKTVVVTFLDPVCVSDCPIIAQELRQVDETLGAGAKGVELVAIVANPDYHSIALTRQFDEQEGLEHLSNWLYLTGSLSDLKAVWYAYGQQVAISPAGTMVAHSDDVYVIDGRSRVRYYFDADPGSGTAVEKSSFVNVLVSAIRTVDQGS